jgi:dihydroflavonol-4-reductase
MNSTPAPTVLVTGGSGFVASHCILELHRAGYGVRSTLRSLDRAAALEEVLRRAHGKGVPVQWVVAALEDAAAWPAAMAGVEFVLHVASPFPRVAPKTPSELIAPARDGVIHVLQAAAAAGVKRVVMTSSTAAITYGYGNRGRPFTADDWSDPESADNSIYTRSKTYAERAAWDFMAADRSGMELVTINPAAILGPVLEKDYGTSAEIVLKLLRGDFPGMPRIGFPLVDVRDVAELQVRALTHPEAAGRRFLCANEFMWLEDIAAVLRAHLPAYAKKMPRRRLPDWLVRTGALFDPVTRSVIFELGIRRDCDARATTETFGFPFRSNREMIIATADTLRAQGLV